jgi:hypothetical protein
MKPTNHSYAGGAMPVASCQLPFFSIQTPSAHQPVLYKICFGSLQGLLGFIYVAQAASQIWDQHSEGEGTLDNGFYRSRREWLGRTHYLLAIER